MTKSEPRNIHIVMRDRFIFEKQCDTRKEAEEYVEYCRRNYCEHYEVKSITESEFAEMLGCVDTPEYMLAVGQAVK